MKHYESQIAKIFLDQMKSTSKNSNSELNYYLKSMRRAEGEREEGGGVPLREEGAQAVEQRSSFIFTNQFSSLKNKPVTSMSPSGKYVLLANDPTGKI